MIVTKMICDEDFDQLLAINTGVLSGRCSRSQSSETQDVGRGSRGCQGDGRGRDVLGSGKPAVVSVEASGCRAEVGRLDDGTWSGTFCVSGQPGAPSKPRLGSSHQAFS